MVDGCRLPDSRCAKVIHQDEQRRGDRAYITQSFDATALRGQQIRYRAFLLLDEPAYAQAQLFVRVERRWVERLLVGRPADPHAQLDSARDRWKDR
jgi:hypothetical protein